MTSEQVDLGGPVLAALLAHHAELDLLSLPYALLAPVLEVRDVGEDAAGLAVFLGLGDLDEAVGVLPLLDPP